jgi:predicted XRE-type DNA-binding protein
MKRQRFDDVFDAICDTPEEAENLKLRADLMRDLASRIAGMSQQEAATLLGVTQPRISELVRGKIHYFALDKLVTMAARAGLHVTITVRERNSALATAES